MMAYSLTLAVYSFTLDRFLMDLYLNFRSLSRQGAGCPIENHKNKYNKQTTFKSGGDNRDSFVFVIAICKCASMGLQVCICGCNMLDAV
jgi:hypothetical protein